MRVGLPIPLVDETMIEINEKYFEILFTSFITIKTYLTPNAFSNVVG